MQTLDLLSFSTARFIPPVFSGYFHGAALVFMFLYLWSRQNPNAPVRVSCGAVHEGIRPRQCAGGWLSVPEAKQLQAGLGRAGNAAVAKRRARHCVAAPSSTRGALTSTAARALRRLQVSLFGIVKLSGRHLPFAFLAVDLIMGANIWSDIQGILMGHV